MLYIHVYSYLFENFTDSLVTISMDPSMYFLNGIITDVEGYPEFVIFSGCSSWFEILAPLMTLCTHQVIFTPTDLL